MTASTSKKTVGRIWIGLDEKKTIPLEQSSSVFGFGFFDRPLEAGFLSRGGIAVNDFAGTGSIQALGSNLELVFRNRDVTRFRRTEHLFNLSLDPGFDCFVSGLAFYALTQSFFRTFTIWHI